MSKILKMDLYRLIRTKSIYISFIVSIVYGVIWSIIMSLGLDNSNIVFVSKNKELGSFLSDFISGNSFINMTLIAITVSIFVSAEYKNGFIKNYIGNFSDKTKWVISKFITVALIVFIILFVSCTTGITVQVFNGGLHLLSFVSLGKMLLTQFLLHAAFACLLFFVCVSTESSALSMVIGLVISFGVVGILYSGIDFIFKNVLHIDFVIENYLISSNISKVFSYSTIDVIIRALAVSVIAIVLFLVLTCMVQKKKDIK